MHFAKSGAYTGELSADMLKACGVEYVVIGHSERRQYFGETDKTVNLRIRAAVEAGLKPIVCVGELKDEREAGYTDIIVDYQTLMALHGLTDEEVKNVVIAYEPVWAIGTGLTATDEQANETIGVIRKAIERQVRPGCRRCGPHPVRRQHEPQECQRASWRSPKSTAASSAAPVLKAPDFTLRWFSTTSKGGRWGAAPNPGRRQCLLHLHTGRALRGQKWVRLSEKQRAAAG